MLTVSLVNLYWAEVVEAVVVRLIIECTIL